MNNSTIYTLLIFFFFFFPLYFIYIFIIVMHGLESHSNEELYETQSGEPKLKQRVKVRIIIHVGT